MKDENRILKCFEIARQRQESHGTPEFIKLAQCGCCKKKKPVGDFHTFSTDLVKNARDEICQTCAIEHEKERKKLWRLVCCGCNETVQTREPQTGAAGFVFEPGADYHVANCPICASEDVKASPIIEMIWFYRSRGIPYE